jgi:hypothetical protein
VYVRFVVDEISEYSGVELGIFQATYRLWRAGQLHPGAEAWWADLDSWFGRKLDTPVRFARSRRRGANECAISWFKVTATRHVARAHEVVALLAEHHVASRMLRTRRPGYVVYEDAFQVAAEPFRPELR